MKKKKVPAFLVGYLTFLAVCILFWIIVIAYVHSCLVRYEASQPEYFVEELVDRLQNDGISSVFQVAAPTTRFESADSIEAFFEDRIKGRTIVYKQDKTNYDVAAPAYHIYADGYLVGDVTLRETSSEPLMFILTVSEWEVASTTLNSGAGRESVTVSAPDTCSVLINGVPMGEGELTGNAVIPEVFQYAKDYVAVPRVVEYQVQGLLKKPVVEVLDADGRVMEYEEAYEEGHTRITVEGFAVSEMDSQLASMVLENAERYTNFFSGDLPGCHNSTKPIADMFPKDSYYLTLADTYRKEDMWMYSDHATPTFENEKISNYIRYSDELFSCEVYFDKKIPLTKMSVTRVDTTHSRFVYGYVDGGWKILDMQTLLD